MIPTYRAKKKYSDEWVEGYYSYQSCDDKHFIQWNTDTDVVEFEEIEPNTLAIHFPDMIDNKGTKIFASLSENGVGGDIVEEIVGETKYSGFVFMQNGCMTLRTDYNGKADILASYTYINEDINCFGVEVIKTHKG